MKTKRTTKGKAFYTRVFKMFEAAYAFQTSWFDGSRFTYTINQNGIEVFEDDGETFYSAEVMNIISTIGCLSYYFTNEGGKIICRLY